MFPPKNSTLKFGSIFPTTAAPVEICFDEGIIPLVMVLYRNRRLATLVKGDAIRASGLGRHATVPAQWPSTPGHSIKSHYDSRGKSISLRYCTPVS